MFSHQGSVSLKSMGSQMRIRSDTGESGSQVRAQMSIKEGARDPKHLTSSPASVEGGLDASSC